MAKVLDQIRKAIRASGKTRYAIFKATGIDQGQLSKLMKGEAGLSLENLEKLADFLGLEIILRPRRKKGKADGKHHQ
jgi:transcriptional regulator with XRE-family HTH domain